LAIELGLEGPVLEIDRSPRMAIQPASADIKARTSRPRSAAAPRGDVATAPRTSRRPPDRSPAAPKTCRGDPKRQPPLSPRWPLPTKIPSPAKVCTSPALPVAGALQKRCADAVHTLHRLRAQDDAILNETRPRPGILCQPRRRSEDLAAAYVAAARGRAPEKEEDFYAPRGPRPGKWSFTTLAEARDRFKQRVHAVERSTEYMAALQEKLDDLKDCSASCSTSCGSSSESLSTFAVQLESIQQSADVLMTKLPG